MLSLFCFCLPQPIDSNRCIGATEDQMASRGLVFDLNVTPDCHDQNEGREQQQGICSSEVTRVIDVDAFDDDVLSSSWRTFQEARKTSQARKRSKATSDDDVVICKGSPMNFQVNKWRKNSLCRQQRHNNQTELIELEASPIIQGKNVLEPAQLQQQVPAIVDTTFSCPICMDKLKNETSTKCGHIFCEECIKKALAAKKWCPVCRKKLRAKDIIRIYLPDVSKV